MYLSPNHPDYERLKDRATIAAPTGPPAPTGELLASFPRPSREGQDAELRLVLDEYQGHEYLSLRVWQKDHAGQFWPTRRGVSVRMGEARGVAEALVRAIDQADQAGPERGIRPHSIAKPLVRAIDQPEPEPTREAPPRRRQRPEGRRDWDRDGSPPPPNPGFDEFY